MKKRILSLIILLVVIAISISSSCLAVPDKINQSSKFIGDYNTKKRVLELYNYTGVTNGQITNASGAQEAFVIHHYNDNNLAQFDNVGRKNKILVLKNARNFTKSKHNETGSGVFIEFLRDCNGELPKVTYTTDAGIKNIQINDIVYDRFNGNVYRAKKQMLSLRLDAGDYMNETKWDFVGGFGNERLGMIDCVDWSTLGISSVKNDYGIALTGRMGDKLSNNDLGRTLKPLLVYSKGISPTKKGSNALSVWSLENGGSCVEFNNSSSSQGSVVTINSQSNNPNSPALKILNKSKNGTNIEIQRTSKDNNGDTINYKDEKGNTLFKITGDGKQIKMVDSVTGQLRTLTISNGKLEIN